MTYPAVQKFLVSGNASLKEALKTIDENASGTCFVVDEKKKLIGLLTDGDIRRAFLKGKTPNNCISEVMNKEFIALPINSSNDVILEALNDRIKFIPLVDKENKVVDYAAWNRLRRIPVAEPLLNGNELAYVTDCIKTSWVSSKGKYVDLFQDQFKEYCQMPFALAVSNGTVALHLALEALGIGPGDEVIVPNLTFAASINSILYTGATPVLADVDKKTWTLAVDAIPDLITKKTKAIMPVHLYGHPCEMDAIVEVAQKNNLFIVEDCAEALGSKYKSQPVGCFGDAATFSFFGNKTITTGEGGMVVFKSKEVAQKATMLRDHGMNPKKRYWHEMVGYNYRMTNLQAAVGVAQMERISNFVAYKRNIAGKYMDELKEIESLTFPNDDRTFFNSYWLFTMLLEKESDVSILANELLNHGIDTRPIFYPMHMMPPYRQFNNGQDLSNSIDIAKRGISLPSAASLSLNEIGFICNHIKENLFSHSV